MELALSMSGVSTCLYGSISRCRYASETGSRFGCTQYFQETAVHVVLGRLKLFQLVLFGF